MVKSRVAVVATLMLGLTGLVSEAAAQSVPLTPPAPQPKSSAARTAPQPQPAASGPKFALPSLGSLFGAKEAPVLDAKQQQLVGRISAYLSNVRLMSGDFVQVGPD